MTTIEISRRVSGRLHYLVSYFLFRWIENLIGAINLLTLKHSTVIFSVRY